MTIGNIEQQHGQKPGNGAKCYPGKGERQAQYKWFRRRKESVTGPDKKNCKKNHKNGKNNSRTADGFFTRRVVLIRFFCVLIARFFHAVNIMRKTNIQKNVRTDYQVC